MTSETNQREVWDAAQAAVLRNCIGRRIVDVMIEEMALGGPDEAPFFTHPDILFVQASLLQLSLDDGSALRLSNWQDDDQFALCAERGVCGLVERLDGIFRVRPMSDFPIGEIGDVAWRTDERGDIQEVTLTISGRTVILRAGEVEEQRDGSLVVQDRDNCVLIFVESDTYRSTVFGRPGFHARTGGEHLSALNA